ncbi:MAG: hypothetical protein ACYSR0_12970 [Planctomycetota bacterium]|jgi:hypothetical protein
MITKEFIDLSQNRVTRKILNFWYKNFRDECYLEDFLSKCIWKRIGKDYIVIYQGPEPKREWDE